MKSENEVKGYKKIVKIKHENQSVVKIKLNKKQTKKKNSKNKKKIKCVAKK